jgi:hypothetical protein
MSYLGKSKPSRKGSAAPLLVTLTGEPFQPVRLYYTLPSKPAATRIFSELRCMDEDRQGARWVWLYQAEAKGLTFGLPYEEIPTEAHPIVIGVFRFPKTGGMVLSVRSFERAIAAARFFGPRLGPRVVLRRGRLINRWFPASDVQRGLADLDGCLDRNVTVIDPWAGEVRFEAFLDRGGRQPQNAPPESDLPEVEDFPLAPEEETEDFAHLTMTLQLRSLRAYEHWNGNTQVRLRDIIYRLIEQGAVGAPS